MIFSFYFILTSIVHTHSSIMCYSKLNNISSNPVNLFDSGVSCETDDTCDYLDVDARMQLKNDPNFPDFNTIKRTRDDRETNSTNTSN